MIRTVVFGVVLFLFLVLAFPFSRLLLRHFSLCLAQFVPSTLECELEVCLIWVPFGNGHAQILRRVLQVVLSLAM